MSFYQKYELERLISGGEIKTFRAMENGTGRAGVPRPVPFAPAPERGMMIATGAGLVLPIPFAIIVIVSQQTT